MKVNHHQGQATGAGRHDQSASGGSPTWTRFHRAADEVDVIDEPADEPSSQSPDIETANAPLRPSLRSNLTKAQVDLWHGLINANRDAAKSSALGFIRKVQRQYEADLGHVTTASLRHRLKKILGSDYREALHSSMTEAEIDTWKNMQRNNFASPLPCSTVQLYKGIYSNPDHPLFKLGFSELTAHTSPVPPHAFVSALLDRKFMNAERQRRLTSLFNAFDSGPNLPSPEDYYKYILRSDSPYHDLENISARVLARRLKDHRSTSTRSENAASDFDDNDNDNDNEDDNALHQPDATAHRIRPFTPPLNPPVAWDLPASNAGRRPGGLSRMSSATVDRLYGFVRTMARDDPNITVGKVIKEARKEDEVLRAIPVASLRSRIFTMPDNPISRKASTMTAPQKAMLKTMRTGADGKRLFIKDIEKTIYSNPDHPLYSVNPSNLKASAHSNETLRGHTGVPTGPQIDVTSAQLAMLHAMFDSRERADHREQAVNYYKEIQHPRSTHVGLQHVTLHLITRYLTEYRSRNGLNVRKGASDQAQPSGPEAHEQAPDWYDFESLYEPAHMTAPHQDFAGIDPAVYLEPHSAASMPFWSGPFDQTSMLHADTNMNLGMNLGTNFATNLATNLATNFNTNFNTNTGTTTDIDFDDPHLFDNFHYY